MKRSPLRALFVVASLLVAMVACLFGGSPSVGASPAAAVVLSQTLVIGGSQTLSATVASGTAVTLSVGYSCTGGSCAGSTIDIPFPSGLAVGTPQLTADVASSTMTGNTLQLTMVDPLAAGTAGQVTVPVTVPGGVTPDGTDFSWQSSMSASNATTSTTSTVSLTASASNNPSVTTSLQSGGSLDQPSVYSIQVCSGSPNTGEGPLQISAGSVLISDLPVGATFESADTDGTWAAGGPAGTVTWTLGVVNGCETVTYTVEYLSSDSSNTVGAAKTESSSWSGQSPGDTESQPLGQDSTTSDLVAPVVTGQFSDWTFSGSQPVGVGMTYFITAHNTGNATWDNLTMTDQVDPKMQVTSIVPTNDTSSPAQLWVSSRLGGGTLVAAATIAANSTITFNPYTAWPSGAPALASDDVVDSFQVIETGVAPNASFTVAGVNATPMAADLNGNPTDVGDTIANTATFAYTAGSTTAPTDTEQCTLTIAPQIPTLAVRNSGPGVLGQSVRSGTFDLTASSGNFATPDPVLVHLLAPSVSMTSWSMQGSPSLPAPTMTEIDNFNNTGWTLFRWTFPSGTVLPTNGWVGITIDVTLGAHAWGTLTDKGMASSTSISPYCDSNWFGSTADANNILGDDDPTKVPCEWDSSISPAPSTEANVSTSAEGHFTTTMVTGPGTAYTSPGNDDTYGVTFNNDGTVPLTDVQVIDVLPQPGDTDILSDAQRNPTNDTFPVQLAGTPTVPSLSSNPVVYYSTAANPCEPDLGYSPGGCNGPAWSTIPPSNLDTVTAVKVDFGSNVINPFTSWEVDLPVTTPTSGSTSTDHAAYNPNPQAPQSDQIAYDTAAFIATSTTSEATLLPAESNPVALRVPSALGPPGAPPSPTALTSTGVGIAVQTATVTIPPSGSVTLLNASDDPVTSLTIPHEGTYVIDPDTGVVTFTPDLGYAGTATPVTYQQTDAFGQTGQSTYTPTVTAPAAPTAPTERSTASGSDTQKVTVPIPPGGSIALLGPGGRATTTVTIPQQGTYTLDAATGTITFASLATFSATPTPVSYRVTDAYGQTAVGQYIPTSAGNTGLPVLTGGAVAATPGGAGYWSLNGTGALSAHGNAVDLGSENGVRIPAPIVGVISTTTGHGYWLVGASGIVYNFGDAHQYGDLVTDHLKQPIVEMARTPDNKGYWLVASDGGVFSFGDARFYGSLGSIRLNQPIVAITPTPDGKGYWLAASDGGVFSFGDARFYGSMGAIDLDKGLNGIVSTPDGRGYWLIAFDGGVFCFGDARFYGSLGFGTHPVRGVLPTGKIPITGIVISVSANGYRLITPSAVAYPFGWTP